MAEKLSKNEIKAVNDVLGAKKVKVEGYNKDKQLIHTGREIVTPNKRRYKVVDFSGKKLKHDKSAWYSSSNQITIKRGTAWEDISSDVRDKILFTERDFN